MERATQQPHAPPIHSFTDAEHDIVSAFTRAASLFRRRSATVAPKRVTRSSAGAETRDGPARR